MTKTIRIACASGAERVACRARAGVWAITEPSKLDIDFRLTHVPSGRAAAMCSSVAAGKRLLSLLKKRGLTDYAADFRFMGPGAPLQPKPPEADVLAAVLAEWRASELRPQGQIAGAP